MNICITYFSKFGNGSICVEYLGKKLREAGHRVTVNSLIDVKPDALPKADLYIFSSPTRVGKAAGKMLKFLKRFQPTNPDARYVAMGTCADPAAKTLDMISEVLDAKGLKKAMDGVLVTVVSLKGPLEESYQERLNAFAAALSSS